MSITGQEIRELTPEEIEEREEAAIERIDPRSERQADLIAMYRAEA